MKLNKGNYCDSTIVNIQMYYECKKSINIYAALQILSTFLALCFLYFIIFTLATIASIKQPFNLIAFLFNLFYSIFFSLKTLSILIHFRPHEFGLSPSEIKRAIK